MDAIRLNAVPHDLRWENPPLSWGIDRGETLHITAGAKTDLFVDPNGTTVTNNSPRLLFKPTSDFTLSAKVTVGFTSKYDAGVLMIYAHERQWGKFCFEFSPQSRPTIVSVITRETSDDCNSMSVEGNQTYLRIARVGNTFAFHMSYDAHFWNLIRYFTLGALADYGVGFSAQSPTGDSCAVTFEDIDFQNRTLADLRSGE
jgi:regulation of enolase protein 1 (concanavalin A-like superfamily)